MEPITISFEEAGKISGLSRTFLRQAMADGRLETRKAGRRRLVLTASLRKFIDELGA